MPDYAPAVVAATQAGVLVLQCFKCTREGRFTGTHRQACNEDALKKGWVLRGGEMICPRCPK